VNTGYDGGWLASGIRLAQTALGAHSEAKTCYQRALELDPANETYQENLRQSEQQLGQDNVRY